MTERLKPWAELNPEERLRYVELIAVPGLSWTTRARLLYEWLRHESERLLTP